ncbi:MAG: metal-dependent hydrolase [Terriglobales bacterium]
MGAQFLDLLWPVFLLLGLEHVRVAPGTTKVQALDFYDYPLSHSLIMAVGWSLLVGLSYYMVRRYRSGAWVVGSLVLSHWFLDLLVHRPDLPLWPGGPKYGLGLKGAHFKTKVTRAGVFRRKKGEGRAEQERRSCARFVDPGFVDQRQRLFE